LSTPAVVVVDRVFVGFTWSKTAFASTNLRKYKLLRKLLYELINSKIHLQFSIILLMGGRG
jgi:hypothetical protein